MQRLLLGFALMFSVACLGDGMTGSSSVTGSYTLRTINGSNLPYTVTGTGMEIVDETITLYEGFTYIKSGHTRTTTNGQVTTQTTNDSGTYGLQGTSITFNSNAGGQGTLALIDGNKLTIVKAGITSVFRK
jgi:hypothetical protein